MFLLNRELLLNNNQLRVLPFELGKLFQLQTLGLKGESTFGVVLLYTVLLYTVPLWWFVFWRGSVCGVCCAPAGNPLAQEIMSLYQEPDGTRRLLNYLLDNLAGAIKRRECCRG